MLNIVKSYDGKPVTEVSDLEESVLDAVLFAGSREDLIALNQRLAARPGPIVPVHVAGSEGAYPVEWLARERSLSVNTTAAGGNAHLMMIG